jgi:hypothetical protein
MKAFKRLIFIFLYSSLSLCSGAQGQTSYISAQHTLHQKPQSPNSIAERVVSIADYGVSVSGSGISYVPYGDSMHFSYSGARNSCPFLTTYGYYAFDYATTQVCNYTYYDNNTDAYQTYDANNNVLTSIQQVWNSTSNTYTNDNELTWTYDANNNMLSNTQLQWSTTSNSWLNLNNTINTYDGNNNLTSTTGQVWNNNANAWVNSYKHTYTIGTGNQVASEMDYLWNTNTNTWRISQLSSYMYQNNGQLSQATLQNWDTLSLSWTNTFLRQYAYTTANKPDSELDQKWVPLSGWADSSKTMYSYDANLNTTRENILIWSSTTYTLDPWVLIFTKNYTYNSSNDTTSVAFITQFGNQTQQLYTYDSNHNLLTQTYQTWNTTTQSWLNTYRLVRTYDNYNNVSTSTVNNWSNSNTWGTSQDTRAYYHYETYNADGIPTLTDNDKALLIYPSPAGILLNIDLTWNEPQTAIISIYDASGRLCKQWDVPSGIRYQANTSVSQLPSGTYYMYVKGQTGQASKSFSVVH